MAQRAPHQSLDMQSIHRKHTMGNADVTEHLYQTRRCRNSDKHRLAVNLSDVNRCGGQFGASNLLPRRFSLTVRQGETAVD